MIKIIVISTLKLQLFSENTFSTFFRSNNPAMLLLAFKIFLIRFMMTILDSSFNNFNYIDYRTVVYITKVIVNRT